MSDARRRARKYRQQEVDNPDRWLVSYADFITLLFAFFVVMYAVSSVHAGKYRALSNTMGEVFDKKQQHAESTGLEELLSAGEHEHRSADELTGDGSDYKSNQLSNMALDLAQNFSSEVAKGLLQIKMDGDWLEVNMRSSLLFASGGAVLSSRAIGVLQKVAPVLNKYQSTISVQGYTDDVPINTRRFGSNWELSAARAASVVYSLERFKVDPTRLQVIAYGENKPIAKNSTFAGRQKNRRVVLRIALITDVQ